MMAEKSENCMRCTHSCVSMISSMTINKYKQMSSALSTWANGQMDGEQSEQQQAAKWCSTIELIWFCLFKLNANNKNDSLLKVLSLSHSPDLNESFSKHNNSTIPKSPFETPVWQTTNFACATLKRWQFETSAHVLSFRTFDSAFYFVYLPMWICLLSIVDRNILNSHGFG